jgi:hypothetical protein
MDILQCHPLIKLKIKFNTLAARASWKLPASYSLKSGLILTKDTVMGPLQNIE